MITLITGKYCEGYRELEARADRELRDALLSYKPFQDHGGPETKVPPGVEATGRRVTPE